jgi:hypothetical protein
LLVAVSGAECVEALLFAGFTRRERTVGDTTLVRGLRSVTIPDVPLVPPEQLSEILHGSGVSHSEFLDYLSESPTEPRLVPEADVRLRSRSATLR